MISKNWQRYRKQYLGLTVVLTALLVVLTIWFWPSNHMEVEQLPKKNAAQTQVLVTPTPSTSVYSSTFETVQTTQTTQHSQPAQSTKSTPTPIPPNPNSLGQVAGVTIDRQKEQVKDVVAQINQAVMEADSSKLYPLLSSQLTSVFDQQAVFNGLDGLKGKVGIVAEGQPNISGDFAKQLVKYNHDNQISTYLMVLHLENGNWKLFGTTQPS